MSTKVDYAVKWGVLALAIIVLISPWSGWVSAYIEKEFFPAAVTFYENTYTTTDSGDRDGSYEKGQDIKVCGTGCHLREQCIPLFVRSLTFPNGEREEIGRGKGIPGSSGCRDGCSRIDAKWLTQSGKYRYHSVGHWTCPSGNTQSIPGWTIEFEIE